jgi:hypothetical protein
MQLDPFLGFRGIQSNIINYNNLWLAWLDQKK